MHHAYPTSLDEVGLNVIDELRKRFTCPVGLSDHTGTMYPALAAMAHGANLIEVHIAFDRRMFGPDVPASVTSAELKQCRQMRNAMETMDSHPVDKDAIAESPRRCAPCSARAWRRFAPFLPAPC